MPLLLVSRGWASCALVEIRGLALCMLVSMGVLDVRPVMRSFPVLRDAGIMRSYVGFSTGVFITILAYKFLESMNDGFAINVSGPIENVVGNKK